MSNPIEFIANLVDKLGRPVFLPKGIKDIPKDIIELAGDVFDKLMHGTPRVFQNDKGQTVTISTPIVWLPEFELGGDWKEVTDPKKIEELSKIPDPPEDKPVKPQSETDDFGDGEGEGGGEDGPAPKKRGR
ncbi:hypothetical protein [Amycolatopsis sp. DSM 110486]|uniref:hypothetical protein n=1 Tax=Amycolatopsis sp. DSM 110486 TaxID=2865832 RepID=UPI001C6A87DE|nr:hypothetical protein [Amycolatopsis sp. DSM 110486]QYN17619.1 hypothetical protein K1T34_33070 [Amycolatopsis sp. DSM 110486]